ncbi:lipopolysaccharide biosynthesis protein [Sphingobacterium sp. 1.A.5]|uniref:lipopolysaccharide biosynthesis protein n=1 Tax=Sphingobacterium sp. 1.A.5 TaxID=2044604 RepID=UPI000C0BCB67|nr:lipopolysaccharide biosynthesis protein [Sphingobacterium sp. 1.A.5]
MKELFKNFLSFGLATTLEKVLLFLFIPIYSKYLLKEEFGVVDLMQVIAEGGSIFALLQLESAFQRYYLDFKGRLKKIHVSSIFLFLGFSSIVIALLLLLIANPLNQYLFDSQKYSQAFFWSILKIPFSNFSIITFIILRFENHTKKFLFYVLLRSISLLVLTILFLNLLENKVNAVIISQFLSSVITCFFLWFYLKNFVQFRYSKVILKKSLKFSIPMVPARVGSFVITYANRFFLAYVLSLSAIGVYSLSLRFASAVQIIYTAFIMAWTPFLFSTLKKRNSDIILKEILPIVAAPVFLLVCVICLFSNELVKYFSTSEFSESAKYIGGLSLFFCLMIFKEIVDIGPKIKEETKFITYNFFASVLVNMVSLFILTPKFGIQGVVLSMIITNVVLVVLSWYVSNKLYYIPFNILKFIIFATPAFALAIILMNYTFSLNERLTILVFVLVFYVIGIIYNLKKGKKIILINK